MKRFIKRVLRKVLPERLHVPLRNFYWSVRAKFSRVKIYVLTYIRLYMHLPLKKQQEKINFGFHLTEHCNLNCAYCNNFSPLAETEFLDFESFRRDIERMGELFNHECDRVRLLGGEPLLHPEIVKFLKTTRENFHTGKITLLTNGTLLSRQPEEFWRTCHDSKITIVVTHYPVNIDVAAIRELAEKFDAEFQCTDEPIKDFFKCPVDTSGSGDCRKNFAFCGRANQCPLMYHGKLFTCTFPPNVRHFNKKFGFNIPVTEADYIDIYKEDSGKNILRRLAMPIPACRFCDLNEKLVEWHISKLDISEWV